MPSKRNFELRRQVGQLLIMGFDGTEMSSRLRVMLDKLSPAGIILFKRNIEHAEQTHELLRQARKTTKAPMFLCVDMEGGTVDRLRDAVAPAPAVAEVAASGSKALFRKHGRIIGDEVRALGFNTDFAPVFDLRLPESQDVLTTRTVSADPRTTSQYAREFLRGLRDSDVVGCGKHFPGLGSARLDSHAGLPVIEKPWKQLWKEDLRPYRALCDRLPFVMVAHAAYPQVTGDDTPASLSKEWMKRILRKRIGYRGLIVTDDLDMGGVLASASIEDAAVETLRAGADMFLVCQKEESVRRAFEAVVKRAEEDKKFARLVEKKSRRVLDMKAKLEAAASGISRRSHAEDHRALDAQNLELQRGSAGTLNRRKRGGDSAMIVAGVMSGTSADGVDVALVRVLGRGFRSRVELLAHYQFPYPAEVRRAVLAAMNAVRASVPDLSRLNFRLGDLYADAVRAAQRRARLECELVGCHGQTIFHQGTAKPFLGRPIACTWQTGEAAVIAQKVGVPVVSDFRPADMAAGGKGAPLVLFLDYVLYRHRRYGRIVQNLGGIGNLTAIPPRATPEQVIAFDTGPGNMVIDAVVEHLLQKPFDRNGRLAARGEPIERVLREVMRNPFFRQKPPKTAGREQFGREFVREFLRLCRRADDNDIIATATALTAKSIGVAVRRFVLPLLHAETTRFREFVVSGGGTKNLTLMQMVREELAPLKLRVRTTDEFGLPSEAKEAAAFALLAYQTWRRLPSNVPSATGAERPAILGKVSYA